MLAAAALAQKPHSLAHSLLPTPLLAVPKLRSPVVGPEPAPAPCGPLVLPRAWSAAIRLCDNPLVVGLSFLICRIGALF